MFDYLNPVAYNFAYMLLLNHSDSFLSSHAMFDDLFYFEM